MRMLPSTWTWAVVFLLAAAPLRAEEEEAPEELPITARIVAAAQAGDAAALAALAEEVAREAAKEADEGPGFDAWVVTDALVADGALPAAQAFSQHVKGEREALQRYLASEAAREPQPDLQAACDAVADALIEGSPGKAGLLLDALKVPEPPKNVRHVLALDLRGMVLARLGRPLDAAQAFMGAAALAEALGWEAGLGAETLFASVAQAAGEGGSYELALQALEKLRERHSRSGREANLYQTLTDLGQIWSDPGRATPPLRALREAQALAESLGAPLALARAHSLELEVHNSSGRFTLALQSRVAADRSFAALQEQQALPEEQRPVLPRVAQRLERRLMKDYDMERWDHVVRSANLDRSLGQDQLGQDKLRAAIEAAASRKDFLGHGIALGNRALLYMDLGRWDDAGDDLVLALAAFEQAQQALEFDATRQMAGVIGAQAEVALRRTEHARRGLERQGLDESALKQQVERLHQRWMRPARLLAEKGLAMAQGAQGADVVIGLEETLGACLSELGEYDRAATLLESSRRAALEQRMSKDVVLAETSLARLRLRMGRPAEAIEHARSAMRAAEQLTEGLASQHMARARLGTPHLYDVGAQAAAALPAGLAGRSRALLLFEFAEAGRAAALAQALGGEAATLRAALPSSLQVQRDAAAQQTILAQIQRLRHHRVADLSPVWREENVRLEADYARALEAEAEVMKAMELAARDDRLVEVLRPVAVDPAKLVRSADEAVVSYVLLGDQAWAVVCTAGAVREVELAANAKEVAALEQDLALLTAQPQGANRPAIDAPEAGPAVERLRLRLLTRLALPASIVRLTISPDPGLAFLPWSMLQAADRPLAISIVPSCSIHNVLRGRSRPAGTNVLAIGAPDYRTIPATAALYPLMASLVQRSPLVEPSTPKAPQQFRPLRHASAEVRAATTQPGDKALLGSQATEDGFWKEVGQRSEAKPWRIVHFAVHGYVDPENPAFAFLALAASNGGDGFLTVDEVLANRCPADLVILSACHTGRGEVHRGEGVMGLARAFLAAGAKHVLATLWAVPDDAAKDLMGAFRKHLDAGASPAEALARAQREAAKAGAPPEATAAWVCWGG